MGNFGRIQIVGGLSDKEIAKGQRYKIWRELEDGTKVEVTSFANMEEMQYAMTIEDENGNDIYSKNATFRQSVEKIAANSPGLFAEPTLARRSGIPTNEEFLASARKDALRQARANLIEEAGGSDLIAKHAAIQKLMSPEYAEAFEEMREATEEPRPYEDYLKQRKQQGLGPMRTYDIDEALNADTSGIASKADADGHVIQIGEQS